MEHRLKEVIQREATGKGTGKIMSLSSAGGTKCKDGLRDKTGRHGRQKDSGERLDHIARWEKKCTNFEHFKIFLFPLPVTHFDNRSLFCFTSTTVLSCQMFRCHNFGQFFSTAGNGSLV